MKKYYKKIKDIKNYLYELAYDELDYDYAKRYFKEEETPQVGLCSNIRFANWFSRNFDWKYDENASFIVRTSHYNNRFASLCVGGEIAGLTNDTVKNRELDETISNKYRILPFMVADGINECSVFCSLNLVPTESSMGGVTTGTVPLVEKREELCTTMLVRYILDSFKTASEAVNYIRDFVSLYSPKSLYEENYELHIMVGDKVNTYILECVNEEVKIVENDIVTNFYLFGVTPNSDGEVYTPYQQDAEHSAVITNNITPFGKGLERYNNLVKAYTRLQNSEEECTKETMRDIMDSVLYSHSYTNSIEAPRYFWFTDYVGDHTSSVLYCNSPVSDYIASDYVQTLIDNYSNKKRDGVYWQTTHSSVYDILNRKLYVTAQEEQDEYEFSLDFEGKSKEFDKYNERSEEYIPNNRIHCLTLKEIENFIIGGTCTYTFKFYGITSKYISRCNFIFRSSTEVFLNQQWNSGDNGVKEFEVRDVDDGVIIETTLSSDETARAKRFRNMFMQVKFTLIGDEVLYSNIEELKVISNLDN